MSEHDYLRKLADDLEKHPDEMCNKACMAITIRAILSRYPDPPATDEEMREKVAIELFYMDTGFVGGKWEGENEYQQKEWKEKADILISLLRPSPGREQLREAEEKLIGALYMVKLLKASSHALRSYENGNSDPTMAKTVADQIDAAITRPPQEEKPKPNSIAGDHTGMKWDGLSGNWYPIKDPPAGKRFVWEMW
jgi:hypothetical protein